MIDLEKEFSFRSREKHIQSFKNNKYDLLIVGGGITGAAVAHKAALLGLSVALVEKNDFASGTSSASSKLIHGGLRYLENMEFGLVFEALKERDYLLKNTPHMVRPLRFVMPVYKGQKVGKFKLSLGMWLYDMLSLFKAPGFHENLSKQKLEEDIPLLKKDGLKGGFRYWDASMWDDLLVIETLRAAQKHGAHCANYCEAITPFWKDNGIKGFYVKDHEPQNSQSNEEFLIQADKVVICAGPWTDLLGQALDSKWKNWLMPSKGVHIVFDYKKLPLKDAIVMAHPQDGRIVFVIPRLDLGQGVVIVGTTDSPSPKDPKDLDVDRSDINYLLALLNDYFPETHLTESDIISTYVGVRPLVSPEVFHSGETKSLQKLSREHYIGKGPGGVVLVAGGKYTTHRPMADEILECTFSENKKILKKKIDPKDLRINPKALQNSVGVAKASALEKGYSIPDSLWSRYGGEALAIYQFYLDKAQKNTQEKLEDPDGFEFLEEQLRFHVRTGMTLHLKDFYFRRVPLFLCLQDHGMSLAHYLSEVLAEERSLSLQWAQLEVEELQKELNKKKTKSMSLTH